VNGAAERSGAAREAIVDLTQLGGQSTPSTGVAPSTTADALNGTADDRPRPDRRVPSAR